MTATRPAPVTSAALWADLEKAFKSKHITVDPPAAADLALGVVLPVLQGMAAEIERLRGLVKVKSGSEGEERHA
jgi:hypothetical protein